MRIFTRNIESHVNVPVGTSGNVNFPDIDGHIVGLGLTFQTSIANTGTTAGTYTARDILRVMVLELQDRAGQSEFTALSLEDIAIIAEVSGFTVIVESSGGDLREGQTVSIAPSATHTVTGRLILPYGDGRKSGAQVWDFSRTDEALQTLSYAVAQAHGSASDITTGPVTWSLRVLWTPDLPGHVGLRREVIVRSPTASDYEVDGGGDAYTVLDILALAPYVAGGSPDLSGWGNATLYEGASPRMTNEPVRDGDAYMSGLSGLRGFGLGLASSTALQVCSPVRGYSNADLLRGRLFLNWSAVPSTQRLLVVRLYGLGLEEIRRRFPRLSGLSPAELARAVRPTLKAGGQPVSRRTAFFTPARFVVPDVIRLLKVTDGR